MKKAIVCGVVLTGLLFFGCGNTGLYDQKPGTATVKNLSPNFDIIYKYKNIPETKTVLRSSDDTFNRGALYTSIEYFYADTIENSAPSKRVFLKTEYPHDNDAVYTFNEYDSYEVKVNNRLGEDATLSADGWMDNMADIPDGDADDDAHTGKIYTANPVFSATAGGFPAEVVYSFTGDTFMVTIR